EMIFGEDCMIMKAVTNPQNLKDYLGSRDLTEHLKLSKGLTFHWANWDQTCLAQRRHYKNFNNNFHLMRMNQVLNELKNKKIWLCNKSKVIVTDLFSLYESYLDSRLRLTWFERKEEILFSYDSEQGPYYTLTSMKWLDKEIYAQFVMRKILLDHFTLRSFRLNANIPVLFKMDNDYHIYNDKVEIHQLSEMGFIFKITDKNFLNKIKTSTMLELSIPVAPYKKLGHLGAEDAFKKLDQHEMSMEKDSMLFKLESRILSFYGNLNNAKRSADEEFYIFARYEDLLPVGHDTELVNVFAPLVEKTKNLFLQDLEEFERLKINKQFIKKTA
ncbi:MAG: hypothetical protein K2Q18_17260, partial [Bdellovibrionales bacterium]|nr:hypothetical protein [Bdellovibrionales bacterium]